MNKVMLNLILLISIILLSCEKDDKIIEPTNDTIFEKNKDTSINVVGCYYPIYE